MFFVCIYVYVQIYIYICIYVYIVTCIIPIHTTLFAESAHTNQFTIDVLPTDSFFYMHMYTYLSAKATYQLIHS